MESWVPGSERSKSVASPQLQSCSLEVTRNGSTSSLLRVYDTLTSSALSRNLRSPAFRELAPLLLKRPCDLRGAMLPPPPPPQP